jgi:uncharacterized protein
VRYLLCSIVLGLPFSGTGCAAAPDTPDEATAAQTTGQSTVSQEGTVPQPSAAESLPDNPLPTTPGVHGTSLQYGIAGQAGSPRVSSAVLPGTKLPGTVSRESVFGRPAGRATGSQAPKQPPASPPAAVPAPTSSVQPVGWFRRLIGSSVSPVSPASASPSSPSPAASSVQSSFRLAERQKLHEKLLFHPAKHPEGLWTPDAHGAEDVSFTASDGTQLHGWYMKCESPRAVVLYAHGNAGNLSYDAGVYRRLRELRATVLAFDYRGYGKSEGTPTVAGVLDDARSARAWLARRAEIPEGQVVLMGRSLGGAVVVQLAGELPPRGLVVESSFASLREVADHHFSKLSWLVPRNELNSAAVLAAYRGPLYVSHGDSDRTIPSAHGQKLFDAARGPKKFYSVPGGDHNDPPPEEHYRRLDRFLSELP